MRDLNGSEFLLIIAFCVIAIIIMAAFIIAYFIYEDRREIKKKRDNNRLKFQQEIAQLNLEAQKAAQDMLLASYMQKNYQNSNPYDNSDYE